MAVTYTKEDGIITRVETFEAPGPVEYEVNRDTKLGMINEEIASLEASIVELNEEKAQLEAI
jgi:hypothetical protein